MNTAIFRYGRRDNVRLCAGFADQGRRTKLFRIIHSILSRNTAQLLQALETWEGAKSMMWRRRIVGVTPVSGAGHRELDISFFRHVLHD